jgi:hypothetical protein
MVLPALSGQSIVLPVSKAPLASYNDMVRPVKFESDPDEESVITNDPGTIDEAIENDALKDIYKSV